MALRGMCYLLIMLVGVQLAAATAALAIPLARPNCNDSCGDVKIPYPFGTSHGCYLNEDFFITCNYSTDPPTAFHRKSDFPVIEITIEDGGLHTPKFVAKDCYKNADNYYTEFNLSNFNLNNTKNKFTVIGCDSYANIAGYIGNTEYFGGCAAWCDSFDSLTNGSCLGIGCCQLDIPKGLTEVSIEAYSYNNYTFVSSFSPCTYGFVVEQSKFNFSTVYLSDFPKELTMVLDWAINGTCTKETANSSSSNDVCGENSSCHQTDDGYGYRCLCNQGYEGNPYLHDGCQDIDECERKLHKCDTSVSTCVNQKGNYTCDCHKGYHKKEGKVGESCIADQFPFVKVAIGTGISIIVLIVCSSWLFLVLKRRKLIKIKKRFFKQNGGFLLQQQLSKRNGSSDIAKIFTAEELKKATNNYAEDRIIGRGGYGIVYKGFLANNTEVAIKKSKIVDQGRIEQFINEVVVLSQINHKNVVRLLGCCLETEVPLLVYEFVSNGTLFEHIHNKEKFPTISWKIRLRIAAETAEVLSYLHSAASTPIIHRDIKSTNILLDNNYNAKVSDFGASKLVPVDESQISTLVQGTLGYLDPEYFHTSQLTEKSDVYSFGVVLVELLTGRKVLLFDRPEEERSLINYFLSSLKENSFFEILENHIVNEGNKGQVTEVVKLAAKCLRMEGKERPTMREVAMELEGMRMMHKHFCHK